jgi:propanediol dehydratase small subunit
MPHHHDHDHDHQGHDHHHGHAHSHASLSFPEKLTKLLDHWIQHNDHHAGDYRKWAQDARDNGQPAVAELLESAAELTDTISDRFREAGDNVRPD